MRLFPRPLRVFFPVRRFALAMGFMFLAHPFNLTVGPIAGRFPSGRCL